MSEKRMFSKSIVLSDAFLDMPPTTRCLYFTLSMLADDDGFVNAPKSIMRQAVIDAINWATKELQEELEKWKAEWQEQVQKATDEGYARTLQTMQLTKAKEIIKKFLLWENDWHNKTESKYELLKQAEQFLKEE